MGSQYKENGRRSSSSIQNREDGQNAIGGLGGGSWWQECGDEFSGWSKIDIWGGELDGGGGVAGDTQRWAYDYLRRLRKEAAAAMSCTRGYGWSIMLSFVNMWANKGA